MSTSRRQVETVLCEFVKMVHMMRFAQNQCNMSGLKSDIWVDEKVKRELQVDQFIDKFIKKYNPSKTSFKGLI